MMLGGVTTNHPTNLFRSCAAKSKSKSESRSKARKTRVAALTQAGPVLCKERGICKREGAGEGRKGGLQYQANVNDPGVGLYVVRALFAVRASDWDLEYR